MTVPKATYEIIYNGKNITGNILPCALSFTYSDKSNGEADEIELNLEDSGRLWQNEWYPTKGDTISAKIFNLGNTLNCGSFEIDEITCSGESSAGDIISIKGIAAGISKKLRTKTSYAHENKTLREIVNTIASKHGLTVQGEIEDIRISRETQYDKTDLNFLKHLSSTYGYTFSIRGNKLTFTNVFTIENKKEALTIKRTELSSWNITDKTSESFKSATNTFHNPQQKKVITHTQTENEISYSQSKADTLELKLRVENIKQAETKTKAALYRANSLQQQGSFSMPGNTLVVAGVNCEMVGIGMCSGKYYIDSTTHTVDPSGGYTTEGQIKRIGLVEKKKQKDGI